MLNEINCQWKKINEVKVNISLHYDCKKKILADKRGKAIYFICRNHTPKIAVVGK